MDNNQKQVICALIDSQTPFDIPAKDLPSDFLEAVFKVFDELTARGADFSVINRAVATQAHRVRFIDADGDVERIAAGVIYPGGGLYMDDTHAYPYEKGGKHHGWYMHSTTAQVGDTITVFRKPILQLLEVTHE